MTFDPFLDATDPLCPRTAAIAIITDDDGRYLLQLRDPKPEIHFPSHWGFFGGALETAEAPVNALVRELEEEIGIAVSAEDLRYFTTYKFDFSFSGGPEIGRSYYELTSPGLTSHQIVLSEGADFGWYSAPDALRELRLMPFDYYALWTHYARQRFSFDGAD